jgi:hypothetical protein
MIFLTSIFSNKARYSVSSRQEQHQFGEKVVRGGGDRELSSNFEIQRATYITIGCRILASKDTI